jgi:hypothetical protein
MIEWIIGELNAILCFVVGFAILMAVVMLWHFVAWRLSGTKEPYQKWVRENYFEESRAQEDARLRREHESRGSGGPKRF